MRAAVRAAGDPVPSAGGTAISAAYSGNSVRGTPTRSTHAHAERKARAFALLQRAFSWRAHVRASSGADAHGEKSSSRGATPGAIAGPTGARAVEPSLSYPEYRGALFPIKVAARGGRGHLFDTACASQGVRGAAPLAPPRNGLTKSRNVRRGVPVSF